MRARPSARVGLVLALPSLLLAGLAVLAGVPGPASAAAGPLPATLPVPATHRCPLGIGRPTYCGHLRVPLDYSDPESATIRIGFGWVPASSGTSVGTLVAQEGGPGYPSTGTAPDFAAMYGSLLQDHDLLVADARGTGRSTPIDCEPLQSLPSPSPRATFARAVAACGRQLDHTWRTTDGRWQHGADLFGTANATRDLAALIGRLGVGPVDLYGDSYGTYFAQAFLARYPHLLRSVVLDSAYEARDLDPWYRTTVSTARRSFDTVCRRAVGCPPGSSWRRIGELAQRLRAHPVTGRVPDLEGGDTTVTVDVTALVNLVNDAGYDTEPYRQLDGAARALLNRGDAVPLLRLYAQDVGWDYSDYTAPAASYSDGLYLAVACTDYPQLFDLDASRTARVRQLDRSIATLPARTFAPFTTREWIGMLPYTETYTGCLDWPAPTHAADPPVPSGPMNPTHVPVLILNGELDSLTPAAGGAHIQRQLDSGAQRVVAADNVHLVALDATACGASIVRSFVASPTTPVDGACAARIPPIRAVPSYPATLRGVTPARGQASAAVRRLAAVAVAAAGDASYRRGLVDGRTDRGLRGGTVRYRGARAELSGVRWTSDTSTSGALRFTADGAVGRLVVRGGGVAVRVRVSWGAGPYATVVVGGVTLRVPSP